MYRLIILFLLIPICTATFASEPLKTATIEYAISMPNPDTHYFDVKVHLKGNSKDQVDFKLPVWTPGSYLVREYAKNVEGFTAVSIDQKALNFHKTNKNTWRIENPTKSDITISYSVYAFEGTKVRMSYLDESHAFIMANTLLMYVDDLKDLPAILKINVPDQWKKISTTLKTNGQATNEFEVPSYDILVDSPIEIGNHDIIQFSAAGVPHEVVMYGAEDYDQDRIKEDLTKIVEKATAIFGSNPNDEYKFIVHHSEDGAGGLEHYNSTVLGVNRWAYSSENSYNSFLTLAAHEYFHLWMVRRLKPKVLDRIDYDEEVYTDLLWVMEGFTSYYADQLMLRAAFYDEPTYLKKLVKAITNLQNTPGAQVQSVADASFDTWIKYYRRNENSNNNQISYYNKGLVLAALLDLEVIHGSKGKKSLDEVVDGLYQQFYVKKGRGIETEDVKDAIEAASGTDQDFFFDNYVFGTMDIDYNKYFEYAGMQLKSMKDSISKTIGLNFSSQGNAVIVSSVIKGGSAYENGIYVGDELLSINGFRINPGNFQAMINRTELGEKVEILVNRKGIIKTIHVEIRGNTQIGYSYDLDKGKSKLQEKVYKAWLDR